MVLKRVTMKKTNTGYSISVFVSDGEVAQALRRGIDRFFVHVQDLECPNRLKQVELDADKRLEDLRHATVVS